MVYDDTSPLKETKKEWLDRISREGGDLWCTYCGPNRGENRKKPLEKGWKAKGKKHQYNLVSVPGVEPGPPASKAGRLP